MRRYITSVGVCLALLGWSDIGLAQSSAQVEVEGGPWWSALLPTLSLEYQRQLRPVASVWRLSPEAKLAEGQQRDAGRWAVLLSWQLYPLGITTTAQEAR